MNIGRHLSDQQLLLLTILMAVVTITQAILRPYHWYTLVAMSMSAAAFILVAVLLGDRMLHRNR